MLNEDDLAPCGEYCGTCKFFNRAEAPTCAGCRKQNGTPFWGACKLYACATEQNVPHCGACAEFPCDLFINQYDPSHGPESAFTRAGLLAYRHKAGSKKYIAAVMRLKRESTN